MKKEKDKSRCTLKPMDEWGFEQICIAYASAQLILNHREDFENLIKKVKIELLKRYTII